MDGRTFRVPKTNRGLAAAKHLVMSFSLLLRSVSDVHRLLSMPKNDPAVHRNFKEIDVF